MAQYTYPTTAADRSRAMLRYLGSFWYKQYQGRVQVQALVAARAQLEDQTHLDMLELFQAASRYEVPIFHKENWYLLNLYASQRNDAQTSLLRFDGAHVFNQGDQFDVPPAQAYSAYPIPADLVTAPLIFNRITEPSVTLTAGIDYQLDPASGAIIFASDPLANPLVAARPVYQDGQVVDTEGALWIFRGDFDYHTIYQQFGYVLGLQLASSRGYRELLNAFFDAIVSGTSCLQLQQALTAMTGVPLVVEPTETVGAITSDANHLLIVTDQHAYRFNPAANPLVSVGQVVTAGDALVDTLQFVEFNRGQIPDDLFALSLGKGFLAHGFYGDLVFENVVVPLQVVPATQHPSGYTYLSFGLGGYPDDVARFFEQTHIRGVAAGQTLAMLLDQRTNKVGQPKAANLPLTINPLEFLAANVLRNNAFLIRVRAADMSPEGVGLYNARFLRRIMPPATAVLVLIEMTAPTDSAKVVSESISLAPAMEPLQQLVGGQYVKDGPATLKSLDDCH